MLEMQQNIHFIRLKILKILNMIKYSKNLLQLKTEKLQFTKFTGRTENNNKHFNLLVSRAITIN